jgi:hypothetical protein
MQVQQVCGRGQAGKQGHTHRGLTRREMGMGAGRKWVQAIKEPQGCKRSRHNRRMQYLQSP